MKLFNNHKSSSSFNEGNIMVLEDIINIELTFNPEAIININPKHVIVSKHFFVEDTVMKGTLLNISTQWPYKVLEIDTHFGTLVSHIKSRSFNKMNLEINDEVYVGINNKQIHLV